jgi:hypothetical protein
MVPRPPAPCAPGASMLAGRGRGGVGRDDRGGTRRAAGRAASGGGPRVVRGALAASSGILGAMVLATLAGWVSSSRGRGSPRRRASRWRVAHRGVRTRRGRGRSWTRRAPGEKGFRVQLPSHPPMGRFAEPGTVVLRLRGRPLRGRLSARRSGPSPQPSPDGPVRCTRIESFVSWSGGPALRRVAGSVAAMFAVSTSTSGTLTRNDTGTKIIRFLT